MTRRIILIDDKPAALIEYSDGRQEFEQLTNEELGNYVRNQRMLDILEEDHRSILENIQRQKDLDDKERELHRLEYGPWTPEELEQKAKAKAKLDEQQDQIETTKNEFLCLWLWNQNSTQNAHVDENNKQFHEFMDTMKSITKELPRPTGPSDLEMTAAAIKVVASLNKPVTPPFEALNEVAKENEKNRKREKAEEIAFAKAFIDSRNEKRRLRRESDAQFMRDIENMFPWGNAEGKPTRQLH